jgi:hypothetical protein
MNPQLKEEYKAIQEKIIKLLFESGKPARLEEICKLTEKSISESKYHCETIAAGGKAEIKDGFAAGNNWSVELTALGRSYVMENLR